MDLSLIIGTIGTVVTIIFGYLSLDFWKRKKYPGKIIFIKLNLVDLLNNVAKNFKEIELIHNNQPISKNLIYFRGALINYGSIDINGKTTDKNISISLPEGCKWIGVKATECSEGLNAEINIQNENQVLYNYNLFRKDEFIKFEGLIESANEELNAEKVYSSIKFDHRLENTSHITKEALRRKTNRAFKVSIIGLTIMFSSLLLLDLLTHNFTTYYKKISADNNENLYWVKIEKSHINLEDESGKIVKESFENFTKKYVIIDNNSIYFYGGRRVTFILAIMIITSICCVIVSEYFTKRRTKKFGRLLKLDSLPYN